MSSLPDEVFPDNESYESGFLLALEVVAVLERVIPYEIWFHSTLT